jgi:L-amino acid N-acyltransferase YncA
MTRLYGAECLPGGRRSIARIYAHCVRNGMASFDTALRSPAQTKEKIAAYFGKQMAFPCG